MDSVNAVLGADSLPLSGINIFRVFSYSNDFRPKINVKYLYQICLCGGFSTTSSLLLVGSVFKTNLTSEKLKIVKFEKITVAKNSAPHVSANCFWWFDFCVFAFEAIQMAGLTE